MSLLKKIKRNGMHQDYLIRNLEKLVSDKKISKLTKYQDVFGKTIIEREKNKKIIGITPICPPARHLNT